MTEKIIKIDHVEYYTLYEQPKNASPDAPLVVLCHALMANHHMYDATVPALHSAGYRTLRYDHVGHGRSPKPPSELLTGPLFHFDDMTKHMRRIVQAVTGDTKISAIIGCSMGGVLAVRYTMLFPGEVQTVLSLDAPGMTALEVAKPQWTDRIMMFEKDVKNGTDELARATVQRWLPGDEERSKKARELALLQTKSCSLDGYKVCADAIRDYDYTDQLSTIKGTRVLVLAGSRDPAIGPKEVLEDAARRIPGSKYIWLEGAGHLPPLHSPEEFNKITLDFLGSHK